MFSIMFTRKKMSQYKLIIPAQYTTGIEPINIHLNKLIDKD